MTSPLSDRFRISVLRVSATLAVLVALVWVAPRLYSAPGGKIPVSLFEVVHSRVVVHNPGVNGYYEQLFGEEGNPMFLGEAEFQRLSKRARDRVFVQRSRHGAPEFVYDASFRIYRFRPNLHDFRDASQPQGLTTNSYGILGQDFPIAKPPHTRRIALLGDSLTQGWGNDQNKSYGRLLENRLNASDQTLHYEVLNLAVPAYDLTQMLDVAVEDTPRYQPDMYLLALTELAVSRTWNEHLIRLIQAGADLKYDFLREIARDARASSDDDSLTLMDKLGPYRMKLIHGTLSAIKSHAGAEHIPFVVALVPSLEDGGMSQNRLNDMPAELAALKIPTIDLQNTFDAFADMEQFRVNPTDVHPNTRGHQMLCDNLYAGFRARPDLWATPASVAARNAARPPARKSS